MHHLARERIGMAAEKMTIRYDARATGHDFHEGDKVWLWNPKRRKGLSPKLQMNWEAQSVEGFRFQIELQDSSRAFYFARLFKKGITYREIVKIVGRSHSCVQNIIGRFKSDGLIENKSGRGRKSILSDVAKRKVLKDIKIDPKLSAVKLSAETS
ncbi:HTH_Tnp_Tc3_2 domain-containing protein [Trichonephila clavipes]|nr:HTH_Tnp_Tc3_2 domain-containing protein [Trichonephila clavipes]